MTARGFYTLLFGCVMLLTSLSVGSEGAFLLGSVTLLCWALSLLCVLLARLFGRIEQSMEQKQVFRGEVCRYTLTARMPLPLPVAPLSLRVFLPNGRQSVFLLRAHLLGVTSSDNDFICPHVGVYAVGAEQVSFSDCFGLFSLSAKLAAPPDALTVLPRPAKAEPLLFSAGEGETPAEKRALSDHTIPADTRAWQDGDELKRVHWKLSMRRQELMVHTYETPQRPDALLLLDCAPPDVPPSLRAAAIDTLCETCAGTLKELLHAGRIARLPLSGETPRELSGQDASALQPMLEALAQESFSRPVDFSRVLLLASRRMRRTGSTAILTTHLTPAIADAAIALRRMGPHTRFTLVTPGQPTGEQEKLLRLLVTCDVEIATVGAKG